MTIVSPPRMSIGAKHANVTVDDPLGVASLYRPTDIFTTYRGSWEPKDHVYSVPLWALEMFPDPRMRPGGDHHLYIVCDRGHFDEVATIQSVQGELHSAALSSTSWVNFPVYEFYDPAKARPPWMHYIGPPVINENKRSIYSPAAVHAGGLPDGEHVSVFVVWKRADWPPPPPPPKETIVKLTEETDSVFVETVDDGSIAISDKEGILRVTMNIKH